MVRMVVALFAVLLVQAQLSKCNAFEVGEYFLRKIITVFVRYMVGCCFVDFLDAGPVAVALRLAVARCDF